MLDDVCRSESPTHTPHTPHTPRMIGDTVQS